MRAKALLIALFFLAAIFSGSALAAEKLATQANPPATRGGQAVGERGVPSNVYGKENKTGENMQQRQQMQPGQLPSGMHKASDLIGQDVYSQQGKDLGEIQNLVIAQDGQVQYIILSRGGIAGVGESLVPVPWQAANLQQRQDRLTASISEQQLQNAPAFDNDHWAQINNPGYEQRVHSYFGTQPQQKNNYAKPYPEQRVPAHQ